MSNVTNFQTIHTERDRDSHKPNTKLKLCQPSVCSERTFNAIRSHYIYFFSCNFLVGGDGTCIRLSADMLSVAAVAVFFFFLDLIFYFSIFLFVVFVFLMWANAI